MFPYPCVNDKMLTDCYCKCFWICMHVFCFGFCSFDAQRMFYLVSVCQTLFNPNKTVVKMFVVMYDLREMPASHQTFLRQRTFSVPVKREFNGHNNKKPSPLGQGRTLRYLVHLRSVSWREVLTYFQSCIQGLNAQCLLSNRHRVFGLEHTFTKGTLWPRHSYS